MHLYIIIKCLSYLTCIAVSAVHHKTKITLKRLSEQSDNYMPGLGTYNSPCEKSGLKLLETILFSVPYKCMVVVVYEYFHT